ncbi:MAG: hypothetical protein Q9186_005380 [Xanthomendoza sp. 1 TL-2023]
MSTDYESIHPFNDTKGFTQSDDGQLDVQDTQSLLAKRMDDQQMKCLAQKGRVYLQDAIIPAFQGQSHYKAPDWGGGHIHEIFERQSWRLVVFDDTPLPLTWRNTFRHMPDGIPPLTFEVLLDQNQEYKNEYGKYVGEPTMAYFESYWVPKIGAVVLTIAVGPRRKVLAESTRLLSEDDIKKRLPSLHQVSDALWLVWEEVGEGNLERLRYYAVEDPLSGPTANLIRHLLRQRWGFSRYEGWGNRLTFDIASEEAQALLASPNGLALAWILIHHGTTLGPRRPVVTIFKAEYRLCMIWDLVPHGEVPTFGDITPPVDCKAKKPPAVCKNPEVPNTDWLKWLPDAGIRPAPGAPASPAPPTQNPPPLPPRLPNPPPLPPRKSTSTQNTPVTENPPPLPPRKGTSTQTTPVTPNPPPLPPRTSTSTRSRPPVPPKKSSLSRIRPPVPPKKSSFTPQAAASSKGSA